MKHELTIKLEVRDESVKATPEELDEEELQYNRMMNELRNLKEAKFTTLEMMRTMQQPSEDSQEAKALSDQIKQVMLEKDHLADLLQANKDIIDERNRKID